MIGCKRDLEEKPGDTAQWACCRSMKTWVQILNAHIKGQMWPFMPVTPLFLNTHINGQVWSFMLVTLPLGFRDKQTLPVSLVETVNFQLSDRPHVKAMRQKTIEEDTWWPSSVLYLWVPVGIDVHSHAHVTHIHHPLIIVANEEEANFKMIKYQSLF